MTPAATESRVTRLLSTIATTLFGGGLAVLALASLWVGREYFLLARDARLDHELHPVLAAGASWGVALGVLGTTLMVVMNLYTLRKKFATVRWLGPMSGWLRFHILCGVFGPIFIVIHGGFTWPTGLIAIGFWCMTMVALSGTFGRYVYGLLPRASGGGALGLHQAREELANLHARLVAETAGADVQGLGALVIELKELEIEASRLRDVPRGLALYGQRRSRIRAALQAAALPATTHREVRTLLTRQVRLIRGLELSQVARRLLRYWHLFHRPLAGAMYVIISVHIAGAVLFGGSLKQLASLWVMP